MTNKIKNYIKSKYTVIILLFILIGTVVYLSSSYGLFKKSQHLTDINFVAGDLKYKIEGTNIVNDKITIAPDQELELPIKITSLNSINSKYELYYLIDGKKEENSDVIIGYTSKSPDSVVGFINASEEKNIILSIKNNSNKSVELTFGVEGGLSNNELILAKGISTNKFISAGDIVLTYTYIGDEEAPTIFPQKGEGYAITEVTCSGAEAKWNNSSWALNIISTSSDAIRCDAKVDVGEDINLYAMMESEADKTTTINFSEHSGMSNTNGIYTTTKTEGNVPVYYYRGKVDNNVIFANYCWKIIRTTETGGIKIIYNGTPTSDGKCNKPNFTAGTETAQSGTLSMSSSATYYYGTSYTFNETTGYYSLAGTIISGVWSNSSEFINKYTCKSTSQTGTCATLYKIKGYSSTTAATYSTLPRTINTETGTSAFNSITNDNAYVGYMYGTAGSSTYAATHANTNNSTIKTYLEGTNDTDGWFNTSGLKNYQDRLEDTVFCNDRSTVAGGNNNTLDSSTYGKRGYKRNDTGYGVLARSSYYTKSPNPTYTCLQANDKFTLSTEIGNGKLKYPVGLLTLDEAVFAGFNTYASNNSNYIDTNNYLYTGSNYWTFSPVYFYGGPSVGRVNSTGYVHNYNGVDYAFGVRPVVSLIPGTLAKPGGKGTSENPYVVK